MNTVVSGIAAAALAIGLAPVAAYATPENPTAAEKATRLADAAETPVMTIDTLDTADTVAGETLLTFEDAADATAFLQETAHRDGLDAAVLIDNLEGATIVTVTSENTGSTAALIHAADDLEGIAAQPNYVYTLPNEVTTPVTITEAATASATDADTAADPLALPTNFPTDTFAAKYQYQFLSIGTGTSKSGANILEAWDLVRAQPARTPVSVGVIDSGINTTHEDLQENVDLDHAYNVFTEDSDVTDAIGHGSTVGGIIGATSNNGKGIAGVADAAPGTVSVIPVKVFTDSGETDTDNLLLALNYFDQVIEDGTVDDVRVINMSLGMRSSRFANPDHAIYRAVSHLTFDHNVLVVGAGGNGDDDNQAVTEPMYPSDYEACLSVTALTETGANAYFSDYNMHKDISAPGVSIAGPSEEGDGYVLSSGTSHAAPIASGVAALMLAVDPTLTPAEVIDIIKSTAVPIPDRSENDWCELSGSAGALDAGGAVRETLKRAGAFVAADGVEVYRLYNPTSTEHLFTVDRNEYDTLGNLGWNREGLAWVAPEEGEPVYRLYNPHNGDHLYTTSAAEYAELGRLGWSQEDVKMHGVVGDPGAAGGADGPTGDGGTDSSDGAAGEYVPGVADGSTGEYVQGVADGADGPGSSEGPDGQPIWRLFNPAVVENDGAYSHLWTADANEHATLVSDGWTDEGIAWYALK